MTAAKQVAQGTTLKEDLDGVGDFSLVELVREITPAGREREEVDGLALADTFDVPLQGIEVKSEFEFEAFWHPEAPPNGSSTSSSGETVSDRWDTAFEDKTVFAVQIVTPHSVPLTIEFDVQVKKLTPLALQPNGTYRRTVTCQRAGTITLT